MTDHPLAGLVMPLEWKHETAVDDLGFGENDGAAGIGGYYTIEYQDGGHFCLWRPEAITGRRYPTLAEAQAAAQADYTARILAALDVEKIEALVGALERIAAMECDWQPEAAACVDIARTALANLG